ncbi:3-oxoacyl-[acyl-carrier-protein] synthase-3 [Actinopolyspora xinjiangensis]|uniref:3-oxoacyl-[acyl-carrier-protein] synthase-3 n=1 Tax=Actinopolyspora xinjiangensis TaxID=405564 RepID=A0A1H0QN91_9ACTN|nr:hypothetical protein [Actinopolyspora xinjiangensis]SDP18219.1 3-oxoacyl-[acyl-carrier-protein] synthase-3 [Actinopolyspora xinjiangensis]
MVDYFGRAGVIGCGYDVPRHVRRNDDPAYDQLNRSRNRHGLFESDMFYGLDRRRFLEADETVEDLMENACLRALDRAGVSPDSIDRLYGYGSVPAYYMPNGLFAVHQRVGISENAMVVPINSEYANFLLGMIHAAEFVNSGSGRYALVVCGCNWTGYMDYTRGHAFSIGDGAGAAVVGPSDDFAVVDHEVRTFSDHYHALTMGMRTTKVTGRTQLPVDPRTNLPVPTYDMTDSGVEILGTVMRDGIPDLVHSVLGRHDIDPGKVALITHQGSKLLMEHWGERIQPGEYLETLAEYGNMTLATYPVNLAHFFDEINSDYLVIAAVGAGVYLSVLLLSRNSTKKEE